MAERLLSPGVLFLVGSLPKLTLPSGIAYLAVSYLKLPRWVCIAASVSAGPVWFWVRSIYRHLLEEREIRALGAVRVPEVKGKWIGNLDLVVGRLKQGKDGYPFDAVELMIRRYGRTFNMQILGENRILTSNPAHIQRMFATDFEGWEKGDKFRWQMSALGLGVFMADADLWKFHRQMTRPFFNRDKITNLEVFSRHCEDALSVLKSSEGVAIDYQDVAFRFTLDSAAEFLLGVRVHSLHDSTARSFGPAISSLQHQLAQRSRTAPLWPLFELKGDKTRKNLETIRGFVKPIIKAALERKEMNQGSSAESETLLDELVAQTTDPKLIMDQTMNVMFAGRDTTAATITFLTYCLATHPAILTRLRAEILAQLGDIRIPTFEDIKQMKLLRAAINETLRLFPPVPGNVRSAVKATTLPPDTPGGKPYYIPKGAKVPFSIMAMHKSKEYWGEDADIWDPDRFLDERNQRVVANPFIFLPFSAGPRICLGQQFAYQEISFFIIRILQSFESIELASDAQPPESLPPASWANGSGRKKFEKIRPKSDLTMSVQGGLWLRLKSRV
ncbi:cytochrome P450 monooxygenase [Mycena albidolilacea]|uniref:Cytochrome P450 monooxygenase n=1 Tax=Mycena albidolilacea TaxID=1033008 RepID=A0AAD7ANK5_9AGAR|nr:cytochrome P450 monooxygenase [Mycena albidolilacea]